MTKYLHTIVRVTDPKQDRPRAAAIARALETEEKTVTMTQCVLRPVTIVLPEF
jgi:Mn-dependent DtxR family transcriptional regulator